MVLGAGCWVLGDLARIPDDGPWRAARRVIGVLQAAGHQAVVAGGAVRDLLLGRPVHDVDVATDAVPDRVEALFPHTIAVGKAFGVVIVVEDGRNIEVATFRADGTYSDGRRPDGVSFGDAKADVERRDYTINALLLDITTGTVIDHVGGRADLDRRILRAVGDPVRRLHEDRLRILRAIRFSAVLGCTIEPATWAAIRATPLTGLSGERIVQEWDKAIGGITAGGGELMIWFRLLAEAGRLAEVFPPLAGLADAQAAGNRLRGLRPSDHADVAAALCVADADPATRAAWAQALPMAKPRLRRLLWLWEHAADPSRLVDLPVPARRRILMHEDAALLARLCQLWHGGQPAVTQIVNWQADEASAGRFAPFLVAADLLALGLKPGPQIGRILRAVEDAQLTGAVTDRTQALAFAARMAATG